MLIVNVEVDTVTVQASFTAGVGLTVNCWASGPTSILYKTLKHITAVGYNIIVSVTLNQPISD
jgi:hypothetical protein